MEDFEKQMCQIGEQPDARYVPMIPQHSDITPVKNWELWPEGICPAFKGYVLENFTANLEQLLTDVDRVFKGKSPIIKV